MPRFVRGFAEHHVEIEDSKPKDYGHGVGSQ